MQFLQHLTKFELQAHVNLQGHIRKTKKQTVYRMEICQIELQHEEEEVILFGVIQPDLLCNLKKGIYFITEIKLGKINKKICGLLTHLTKIYFVADSNPPDQLQNPFIIQLKDYFNDEEFNQIGITLYQLNERLGSLKKNNLKGLVLQVTKDIKSITLVVMEETTYSTLTIDLICQDQECKNYQVGQIVQLINLVKQNRVLYNTFKGYENDQIILQNDNNGLRQTINQDDISYRNYYRKYFDVSLIGFSNFNDIKQYTLDRQIRKFKIDLLKTHYVGFQFTCTYCNSAVRKQNKLYKCSACQTILNQNEFKWEISCIIQVKNQKSQALLKIKEQVFEDLFSLDQLFIQQIKDLSLSEGRFIVLREELQYQNQLLKQLYKKCYQQALSKVILAQPYCDFTKTAKIKNKWMNLKKLGFDDQYIDYFEWFHPNEYEKLTINPNGSFDIKNFTLKQILCLECLGVREVPLTYWQQLI